MTDENDETLRVTGQLKAYGRALDVAMGHVQPGDRLTAIESIERALEIELSQAPKASSPLRHWTAGLAEGMRALLATLRARYDE